MLKIIEYVEGMAPEMIAPCVIAGMPNDVYHASYGISKSGLDKISRSPAHYRYAEHEPSKVMEIGSALHCAVLEPEVFAEQYLCLPEIADRRASEYKKAVMSRGAGNVLVGKEVSALNGMVKALSSHYKAAQLMQGDGLRELAVFARDPVTGVLCKEKFDYLGMRGDVLYGVDLKSTSDAREEPFSRSMANYRYHVQAAFYSDVFYWATGQKLEKFWFVAVESKAPHGVLCRYLDSESEQIGRDEYQGDLVVYADCLANDYWPCYEQSETDDDCAISLPGWKIAQYENDVFENIE